MSVDNLRKQKRVYPKKVFSKPIGSSRIETNREKYTIHTLRTPLEVAKELLEDRGLSKVVFYLKGTKVTVTRTNLLEEVLDV